MWWAMRPGRSGTGPGVVLCPPPPAVGAAAVGKRGSAGFWLERGLGDEVSNFKYRKLVEA